jgi:hypothetical protein
MISENRDPEAVLIKGCGLLDRVFQPNGFRFVLEEVGVGSGGRFASGRYIRGDRSLELHVRHSLGLVRYHIGHVSLDHETFMRMLGVRGQCSYPDFPKEPLDSFQSLAKDLELYCNDFLAGTGDQFRDLSSKCKNEKQGFASLS